MDSSITWDAPHTPVYQDMAYNTPVSVIPFTDPFRRPRPLAAASPQPGEMSASLPRFNAPAEPSSAAAPSRARSSVAGHGRRIVPTSRERPSDKGRLDKYINCLHHQSTERFLSHEVRTSSLSKQYEILTSKWAPRERRRLQQSKSIHAWPTSLQARSWPSRTHSESPVLISRAADFPGLRVNLSKCFLTRLLDVGDEPELNCLSGVLGVRNGSDGGVHFG
jgi:hypothetical protein